jgi:vacuolar-type H+-ATPase subunit H
MRSPENREDKSALSSATEALSDLKEKSKAVVSDAVGKAADGAMSARTATSQLAADLADTLREGAETQKNVGAAAVATLARLAREAARDLQGDSPEVARLVRTSADAVERVSMRVRSQSLSDLVDATGQFAVRHPVAFFGCGVLAGFVAARLLSSPQR